APCRPAHFGAGHRRGLSRSTPIRGELAQGERIQRNRDLVRLLRGTRASFGHRGSFPDRSVSGRENCPGTHWDPGWQRRRATGHGPRSRQRPDQVGPRKTTRAPVDGRALNPKTKSVVENSEFSSGFLLPESLTSVCPGNTSYFGDRTLPSSSQMNDELQGFIT